MNKRATRTKTRGRQMKRAAKSTKTKRPRPLTEETIRRIVNKMPGGLHGFCVGWGWLNFARRIERAHRIQ